MGPGFHSVTELLQLGWGHKGHLGNHLLTLINFWGVEEPVVDYSEVDAADLGRIIVEQGDNPVGVICFYGNFFSNFTLHGGKIIFV